mmetsp:Transcript_5788/g.12862  ORF Transcript_5788/g.12862 Transcript_5788/m.12862 type:complete len:93 (+) Transcript_5788:234-512(+)
MPPADGMFAGYRYTFLFGLLQPTRFARVMDEVKKVSFSFVLDNRDRAPLTPSSSFLWNSPRPRAQKENFHQLIPICMIYQNNKQRCIMLQGK